MAVKIRFARIGKKHAPIYKIVAIDSRRKRDGKYLENLGTYNPKTKKLVQFHTERVQHWISVGAQPTEAVARLIKLNKQDGAQAAGQGAAATSVKKVAKKTTPKKSEQKSESSAKSE